MSMKITTVGTGCCIPRASRRGASALVECDGLRLVVDLGLGALRGLLDHGVTHRDVDVLLLTHFHPDHVADLPSLFFAANYDTAPRSKPLTLAGSAELEGYLSALAGLHGRWVEPQGYELDTVVMAPGQALSPPMALVRAGPASHTPGSLSYRIEAGGRSAVFTGDTGPSDELAGFAAGCDLLVADCSLPEGYEMELHMTAAQAGRMAAAAGAARLVLTHFYPEAEAGDPAALAAKEFGGEITVARDGACFHL